MKNQAPRVAQPESGSIFFWLFFMILLFGVLSFAMTQGFRSGGAALNSEQIKIKTSEILDFATQIRNGVKQMQINGCEPEQINFATPLDADYPANPDAPASGRCDFFGANGAKMRYAGPAREWTDMSKSGENGYGEFVVTGLNSVPGVGTDCGNGEECSELVLLIPFIHQDICKALNYKLGLSSDPDEAPPRDLADIDADRFAGSFVNNNEIADNDWSFSKRPNGCFEGGTNILKYASSTGNFTNPAGTFHFYQVLIAK